MNYKTLLTSDFWFQVDRSGLHLSDKIILWIAVGLVVLACLQFLGSRYVTRPFDKEILRKLAGATLWFGLLELLWFVFRYEYATMLGTHAAALVIALPFLIRIGYLKIKYLRNRKVALAIWQKEQVKLKYLPKQQ